MPQHISGDKILLSTSEACEITGFSVTYIARLLRDKRVDGVRVGSVWLIYEDSLRAFIAQPRKRGPKGPHKKSLQNHKATLPNAECPERTMSDGKENKATKQSFTPGT